MSITAALSAAEQQAHQLIRDSGGLSQSELWKALGVSSRTGSRIARSLAEKGLITRERTVHEGRITYLLIPVDGKTEMGPADSEAEPPQKELTPRERHALALIEQADGFYQSELWKALGVSSRTGTRIATALEATGIIMRDPVVYNGRKTYRLTPTPQQLDFSLLMAGDEISPFISADEVDPRSEAFTHWLMELARGSAV